MDVGNFVYRNLPFITGSAAIVLGYASINRHFIGSSNLYKRMVSFTEEDEPRPLDDTMQNIVNDLTDYFLSPSVDLHPSDLAQLKVFLSTEKDTTHFGSHISRFGTYVGVPETFIYKSRSDINQKALKRNFKLTEEDPEAFENLTEALMLSERAKRFAVATELHAVNTYYVVVKLQYLCCIIGGHMCGYLMAPYTTKQAPELQLGCLVILVLAWYTIYKISMTSYNVRYICKADRKTAEMGEEYVDGGIEYLTKLQQRNIALRKLQKDGEKQFTESGEKLWGTFEFGLPSLGLRLKRLEDFKSNNFEKLEGAEAEQEQVAPKEEEKKEDVVKEVKEVEPEISDDPGILRRMLRVFV